MLPAHAHLAQINRTPRLGVRRPLVAVLDTPPEGGVHPVEVQAAVGRGPYHLTIRRIAAPPPPPPAPEVDPQMDPHVAGGVGASTVAKW